MNNLIPFIDLKQQYKLHQEVFEKAIREVCVSGSFVLGPEVERFEGRFADYIGVRESVGVASGTDALRLACQAIGIGCEDEVLIPANTFIASVLAVSDLGATVVLVDVDPETFLVDMDDAERKLTSRTKAIMPVHLYGQSVNMDAVAIFADKHNLIIIEDACQSHG
ncbi:MAG: aminotransferase class I/II-fold pyridoxal phosphate-dependent enzyme, partial [Candidatus Scalindua sp.]|nr:aminotransferase class I/II-fold pyridoxal phosphate-dependent enzyme [Candidatus Scalindua sp.]